MSVLVPIGANIFEIFQKDEIFYCLKVCVN